MTGVVNTTGARTGAVGTITAPDVRDNLLGVRQDLTILALREAVTENRVAYNQPNSFVDQFQDDSGIGTETNIDRASGEYMTTIYTAVQAFSSDSNTMLLLHMEDVGLTDSSTETTKTMTITSGCSRVSNQAKFGTYSAYFDGTAGGYLTPGAHADFAFGTGNYTAEGWFYYTSTGSAQGGYAYDGGYSQSYFYKGGATAWTIYSGDGTSAWSPVHGATLAASAAASTWHHFAITRDINSIRAYHDGVQESSTACSGFNITDNEPRLGDYSGVAEYIGWIDEFRISDVCRYPDGTSFTPNSVTANSATATVIGIANVPSSAQTKVSGVMLYKDTTGTATISTTGDLQIYFTCNGGTNWTQAASYTAVTPVFSTGIKMVKLGETTCTSGSDVRYKAVWANQASGSKVTELHGIGVNY